MKIKTIVLALFFLTTLPWMQEEMKTYEKDGFSVEYPSSWIVDESGTMNTKVILKSDEVKDGFSQNLNVIMQDVSAYGLNLDQLVGISEGQFKQMPKAKVVSSERIKDEHGEKHAIVIQGDFSGPDVTVKQYYMLKGKMAYVVTYTNLTKEYPNTKDLGDKILNSFTIK
jgi:hypothetical protein